MSRKVLYALILIACSVIVLVVNRESVSLDLVLTKIRMLESFAYLLFIAIGVAIGMLLK